MSCTSFKKSSCVSPLLRQKKILSGRIVKKYQISSYIPLGSDLYPAERFLLKDQIFTDLRHSEPVCLNLIHTFISNELRQHLQILIPDSSSPWTSIKHRLTKCCWKWFCVSTDLMQQHGWARVFKTSSQLVLKTSDCLFKLFFTSNH